MFNAFLCDIPKPSRETSSLLLTWLVELANIESLTFFSNTLEVLSTVPDLLKVELHSLSKRRKKEKGLGGVPLATVVEMTLGSSSSPLHFYDLLCGIK
ncbi:hypothetical protein P8452_58191 [Trifolium repens]|nr:hypothetical protein P8452_58191 [Trifolium repens]